MPDDVVHLVTSHQLINHRHNTFPTLKPHLVQFSSGHTLNQSAITMDFIANLPPYFEYAVKPITIVPLSMNASYHSEYTPAGAPSPRELLMALAKNSTSVNHQASSRRRAHFSTQSRSEIDRQWHWSPLTCRSSTFELRSSSTRLCGFHDTLHSDLICFVWPLDILTSVGFWHYSPDSVLTFEGPRSFRFLVSMAAVRLWRNDFLLGHFPSCSCGPS